MPQTKVLALEKKEEPKPDCVAVCTPESKKCLQSDLLFFSVFRIMYIVDDVCHIPNVKVH